MITIPSLATKIIRGPGAILGRFFVWLFWQIQEGCFLLDQCESSGLGLPYPPPKASGRFFVWSIRAWPYFSWSWRQTFRMNYCAIVCRQTECGYRDRGGATTSTIKAQPFIRQRQPSNCITQQEVTLIFLYNVSIRLSLHDHQIVARPERKHLWRCHFSCRTRLFLRRSGSRTSSE